MWKRNISLHRRGFSRRFARSLSAIGRRAASARLIPLIGLWVLSSSLPFKPLRAESAGSPPEADSPRDVTLGFIPDEALTLSWDDDFGFRRFQLEACENLNEASEWLDVCGQISSQSSGPTALNLALTSSTGKKPGGPTVGDPKRGYEQATPRIRLSSRTRVATVTFVPMLPVPFQFPDAAPSVKELAQAISIDLDPHRQEAHCRFQPPATHTAANSNSNANANANATASKATASSLSSPWRASRSIPGAPFRLTQVSWRLSQHKEGQEPLVVPHDTLPLKFIGSYEQVRCDAVFFDGTLFKKVSTSRKSDTLTDASSPVHNVVDLSLERIWTLDLGRLAGPLARGESYACHQLSPRLAALDLCSFFDPSTGRAIETPEARNRAQLFFSGPERLVELQVSRAKAGAAARIVPVQFRILRSPASTDPSEGQRRLSSQRATAPAVAEEPSQPQITLAQPGPLQFLQCLHDAPSGGVAGPVRWNLNGQPLRGWSSPWLPSFFLNFGNEYSCTMGSETSAPFRLGALQTTLYAPARILLRGTRGAEFARVEPSLFIPADTASWQCASDDETIVCEVLGDRRNQHRLLRVRVNPEASAAIESKERALPPSTQLTLTLKTDGRSLMRTIQVVHAGTAAPQIQDLSPFMSLVAKEPGRFECLIAQTPPPAPATQGSPLPGALASHATIHWFLDGKPLPEFANQREISLTRLNGHGMLSCLAALPQGAAHSTYGLASRAVSPPPPEYEGLPEELIVDVESPISLNFAISSRLPSLSGLQCVLTTVRGEPMSGNVCSWTGSESRPQSSPPPSPASPSLSRMKATRNAQLALRSEVLESLKRALARSQPQDPFHLDPLRLNLTFTASKHTFSTQIPVRAIIRNARPRIAAAVSYVDRQNRRVCAAIAWDAQLNHLTARLSLQSDPRQRELFSTLNQSKSVEALAEVFGADTPRLPHGALFAALVLPAADRSAQPPADMRPARCEALLSDGTLIATSQTTAHKDPRVALALLTNAIRKLDVQVPEPPLGAHGADESQDGGTIPSQLALAPRRGEGGSAQPVTVLPLFAGMPLVLDGPGKVRVALPFETRLWEGVASCAGPIDICRQIFVEEGSLAIANTTGTPSGVAHVVLRSAQGSLAFLSLEVLNRAYLPEPQSPAPSCYLALRTFGNAQGAQEIELSFSARFADGSESFVPASLIGRALGVQATDILCHQTLRSGDGRVVAVRSSSLKDSIPRSLLQLGSELPPDPHGTPGRLDPDEPPGAPLTTIASGPVSIPNLIFHLRPELRGILAFMSNIRLQSCAVGDSFRPPQTHCTARTLDLSVPLPEGSRAFALSTTMSGTFLGKAISFSLKRPLARATENPQDPFMSVELFPVAGRQGEFRCSVTDPALHPRAGAETSAAPYQFRAFLNGKLVAIARKSGRAFTFPAPLRDEHGAVQCEVTRGARVEVATFRKAIDTDSLAIKCMALDDGRNFHFIPCALPAEIDFGSDRFDAAIQDAAQAPVSTPLRPLALFRYVLTAEDGSLRYSRTFAVGPLSSTSSASDTAITAAPTAPMAGRRPSPAEEDSAPLPTEAIYVEEWSRKAICLFGLESAPARLGELEPPPSTEPPPNRVRSDSACAQMALLPPKSAPAVLRDASVTTYAPSYVIVGPDGAPGFRSQAFVPDAELIVDGTGLKPFHLASLASAVRRLSDGASSCALSCATRAGHAATTCLELARRVTDALPGDPCRVKETASAGAEGLVLAPAPTIDAPGGSSSLVLDVRFESDGGLGYTAAIAHLLSPVSEEPTE